MSKTELEGIFAKYGAVIGISVHKGYAFIQYANETSARAAVLGEDSKPYYNMALVKDARERPNVWKIQFDELRAAAQCHQWPTDEDVVDVEAGWAQFKNIINLVKFVPPYHLLDQGTLKDDPGEQADIFARHYESVYESEELLPEGLHTQDPNSPVLAVPEFNPCEVQVTLENLNTDQSPGPDGLHP
ncbi:unnamed protein product [Echinostoma caproni]|uniref:RRM domain-containing protein n=1 Tax=Echinostoma caproni TaxID=27848 RepID=A0A183BFD8_9TREM|nr:unnamed protein product [Echinostoma caproni]